MIKCLNKKNQDSGFKMVAEKQLAVRRLKIGMRRVPGAIILNQNLVSKLFPLLLMK